MANTPIMQGIKNSWPLKEFAKIHGKMKIGTFTNKKPDSPNYGKQFKSCVFVDPANSSNVTFMAFSSKLGELTPQEIVAQKDELQVVELESGNYSLCHRGDAAWTDVDLGL